MKMMKIFRLLVLIALISPVVSFEASAHCEIPCGIYDDSVRVKLIREHIQTIEKSMNSINSDGANNAQGVRWVMNKEEHANKIQEIVSQYFLHQRIKPVPRTDRHGYGHYVQKLELLHRMQVAAMKCKQTSDLKYVEELKQLVLAFEKAYFEHSH